jgi:hypothetical protein
MLRGSASLGVLLFAATLAAVEVPSIAPQVSSVFPHGAQQGAEVEVEFRGTHLDSAVELRFVHPAITAEILGSAFRSARARVRVGADVEAGRHDFRLITGRGAFLGVFQVGTLAERAEIEPNDSPAAAQSIRLPEMMNGVADGADADYYRFQVKAGQTLVFDINASRSASALDPVLALLDGRGREIAYCDDYYSSRDARLVHTFKEAGEYFVRVSASFERSASGAEYRLLATGGPYPAYSLPLGGRRGSSVDVRIRGFNLEGLDRAWLGAGKVKATVVSRSATEASLQLTIPADLSLGSHQLHLAARDGEVAYPLPFQVSDIAELSVTDSIAGDPAQPYAIKPALILNGEIGWKKDYLRRAHTFEFEARGGERFEFVAESWALGMRFDPVLTLLDAEGNVVAQEDDPAPNSFIHHPASHDPCLVYEIPKSGRYRLQIRDAAYQAGDGSLYRLTFRQARPSFQVEMRAPHHVVYTGRGASLLAVVQRTGGVHKVEAFKRADSEIENFRIVEGYGWNEPVSVWLEGLPAGVSSATVIAEPKNTTFKGNDSEDLFVNGTVVEIPVRATTAAKPGLYEIRLRAKGTLQNETVERQGRVLYGLRGMRAEPTQDQKLWLNVVQPPPVLVTAPATVTLRKGSVTRIKLPVFRFAEGDAPITMELKDAPPGLQLKPSGVSSDATEAELVFTTAGGLEPPGQVVLVAKTLEHGREVRVESAPVEVKVDSQ